MIHLDIYVPDFKTLAAVGNALANVDGVSINIGLSGQLAGAQLQSGNAQQGQTASAMVTSEKQETARASTAAGKAAKAAKEEPKPPKEEPAKETVSESTTDAIVAASTVTPPTYEKSGVPDLIVKASAKNKDATIALLKSLNAINGEGKVKGSAMPPENFAAALEGLAKIAGE